MPLWGYFLIHGMELRLPYSKFLYIFSLHPFQRYGAGAMQWLDARGCKPKLTRGSPLFLSIVDWSELNAFVSNFCMFLNYRYGAKCLFLHKMVQILDFSAPFVSGCTAFALRKKRNCKNKYGLHARAGDYNNMLVRDRHLQLQ